MKPQLGAGARGGHVIGFTRHQRPIYMSGHAKYAAMHVGEKGSTGTDASHLSDSFGHYTHKDHEDAASAHFKEAYKVDNAAGHSTEEGAKHLRASLAHNRLSIASTKKSLSKSNGCARCGKSISGVGHDD